MEHDSTKKPTMAEMLPNQSDPKGPHIFEPEKIKELGFASSSNGIPSIYFSGSETQLLAESLGFAIVGKFSHSIPGSSQIQKALDNMKFTRGFTWKYINAKHVLIQLEDLGDYARLLNGPKDIPVWYVDRHPMRVFKWSPDFDVFCESPIAAIWCNLIGLLIHLFDQSALFAIGKLLRNPIQIDRATANKSRLSFARICVEIDITKPVPEEIILDICGRVSIQNIKWDKIPPFCLECRHVGHSEDTCYASGKREKPPKKNYNDPTTRRKPFNDNIPKEKPNQQSGKKVITEWHRKDKEDNLHSHKTTDMVGVDHGGVRYTPTHILDVMEPESWGDTYGREEGNSRKQGNGIETPSENDPSNKLVEWSRRPPGKSGRKASSGPSNPTRRGQQNGSREALERGESEASLNDFMSINKYHVLMGREPFEIEDVTEEEAMDMDLH